MQSWIRGITAIFTSPRLLSAIGVAFCLGYVAGLASLVFIVSIYIFALSLADKANVKISQVLVLSLLIHIVVVGISCVVLFPLLKHLKIIPLDYLFNGSVKYGFKFADSTSVSQASREISRVGALLILASPALLSLSITKVKKRITWSEISRMRIPGTVAVLAVLIPYAILKFNSPWYAIAPFASGDGRNNFLLTMSSRLSTLKPLTFVDVGILPNCLAGLISAGNGAQGQIDITDVWAIAFVYLVSIVMIVSSFSTSLDFSKIPLKWRTLFTAISLISGILFALNPSLLSFCLNDGFFSLYFACAILIAGATYVIRCDSKVLLLVCAGAVTLALTLGYVLLLPTWLVFVGHLMWHKSDLSLSDRSVRITLVVVSFAVGGAIFFIGDDIWSTYLKSVTLRGAFIPFGPWLLGLLVVFQISISLATNAKNSLYWRPLANMGIVTLSQYAIIEIANSTLFLDDDSYYGTKIIVAATSLSLMLSSLLIVDELFQRKIFLQRIGLCFVVSASVFSVGPELLSQQIRLTSAVPSMLNRWGYPDALEFEEAAAHWDGPSFIFLEYSKSLEYAEGTWRSETQSANDRLLNFWSPIFWNISEDSNIETYNWIYEKWNPTDLGTMCSQLKLSIKLVITRSKTLEKRLLNECGWAPIVELQN